MLENLNPQQKQAVETTDGAVLVLSGAGTGKTRVLTARTAYILSHNLAQPWQILALTFTNKAALEMKSRISNLAANRWNVSDLWCGTFHSICLRMLRANSAAAGLHQDFLVFGEDDQKAVLKTVITGLGLDTKQYVPSDYVEKISSIKDKGLNHKPDSGIQKIYNAYNNELTRLNAVDFGDIILKVLNMFKNAPDVLQKYQKQFKYIMVDEFQDTNNAQHEFLNSLANGSGNICCVGDDDQSIYSWRGAEIKHILNFNKNYPNGKIIRLETNYRSTENILNAANSLIKKNTERLGKDLRAAPGVLGGEKVYVMTLPTDWDEARLIAQTIKREYRDKKYSDVAVLIRAGSLSRLFEEEFTKNAIPYRLIGATKFYDRMEIRDVVAYIRLLVYQFDDLSFLRIISKPRRGFGDMAISKLRQFGGTLMAALRAAPLSGRSKTMADEFLSALDIDWADLTPADAVSQLLENSGYLKMWRESKDSDAPDRLSNIKELLSNVISKYDSLPEFLEHAALMMTDDDEYVRTDVNAVNIMTIHAAKGLEFDTVFLPAWEDGIFPNEMATKEGSLSEERRLAYVAITRARRRAIITNAFARTVFGQRQNNAPSCFISEMDTRYLIFNGAEQKQVQQPQIQKSFAKKQIIKKTTVGKLVVHSDLGRGVVIEDSGNILTIAFRDKGIKKIATDFVKFID